MSTRTPVSGGLATVTVTGDTLWVRLRLLPAVLSRRRRLVVPISQVRGIHRDPGALIKAASAGRRQRRHPPFVVGVQRGNGGRSFWAWRTGRNAVRIDLRGHRYDYVVVEVPEPQAVVQEVRIALSRR